MSLFPPSGDASHFTFLLLLASTRRWSHGEHGPAAFETSLSARVARPPSPRHPDIAATASPTDADGTGQSAIARVICDTGDDDGDGPKAKAAPTPAPTEAAQQPPSSPDMADGLRAMPNGGGGGGK